MVDQPKQSRADCAVELVTKQIGNDDNSVLQLFHTPDGEAYTSLRVQDHYENMRLRSRAFRSWLAKLHYEHCGKMPSAQAMQDALAVLEGRALFEAPEHEVHIRICSSGGVLYIDLADEKWRAVAVDASGWRVPERPPVKFRRSRGMKPLPLPERGGTLKDLRCFVNMPDNDDWRLFITTVLGAYLPDGPKVVVNIIGEQGSGKSTDGRVIRKVVDPNIASLRSEPRNERDLAIAAGNSWVQSFDNISTIPPWLSDALCRLSTGGGFATRQLHTDTDEVIIDVQRPVVITGIAEVITRPDLLDRTVQFFLHQIPPKNRRPEKQFWAEFDAAWPRIFGALLDALSGALRAMPTVMVPELPRMGDFATLGVATETALGWPAGSFLSAYEKNRLWATQAGLDASPIAAALQDLVAKVGTWKGSATELLDMLNAVVSEEKRRAYRRAKVWPQLPHTLSGTLRRLAPSLRDNCVEVTFTKVRGDTRIYLKRAGNGEAPPPPPGSTATTDDNGRQVGVTATRTPAGGGRESMGGAPGAPVPRDRSAARPLETLQQRRDRVRGWEPKKIPLLTAEEIAALTALDLANMFADQIERFTSAQVPFLALDTLRSAPASFLRHLTAVQARAMTRAQTQMLLDIMGTPDRWQNDRLLDAPVVESLRAVLIAGDRSPVSDGAEVNA